MTEVWIVLEQLGRRFGLEPLLLALKKLRQWLLEKLVNRIFPVNSSGNNMSRG